MEDTADRMTPDLHRREFYVARTKILHGMLLAAVLGVIGVGSIVAGDDMVPGAVLVGVVNLAIAAGIFYSAQRSVRDRRPHMVLDREGVWYRGWGVGKVRWAELLDTYPSGARVQAYISLRLADPEGFVAALPDGERTKLKGNRLYRSPELRIPHGALDEPLEEILNALRSGLSATRGQAGAGTEK